MTSSPIVCALNSIDELGSSRRGKTIKVERLIAIGWFLTVFNSEFHGKSETQKPSNCVIWLARLALHGGSPTVEALHCRLVDTSWRTFLNEKKIVFTQLTINWRLIIEGALVDSRMREAARVTKCKKSIAIRFLRRLLNLAVTCVLWNVASVIVNG